MGVFGTRPYPMLAPPVEKIRQHVTPLSSFSLPMECYPKGVAHLSKLGCFILVLNFTSIDR